MKAVSIRTSLLRNLLLLVLSVSATILVVLTVGAQRTVQSLCSRLITQSSDRSEDAMESFFGEIEGMLKTARAWSDAGLIRYRERSDLERLNAVFIPVLERYPQITSMMVAHDEGFEYLLLRNLEADGDHEWYNRIVWADRGPESGFEARLGEEGELLREGPLPGSARDYDPRRRPFYTEPGLEEPYWAGPYYFFITKDAGLTASYKWRDARTGKTRLVAFDLLLRDLSAFTSRLRPSENGRVFVMHPDGSLLGLPADERWGDPAEVREVLRRDAAARPDGAARLLTARELEVPPVEQAIAAWREAGGESVELFHYEVGDEGWWGGLRSFPLDNQRLWIGVVVPERDFLDAAYRQRRVVLLISAAALLAAVLMTGILARRYSRPLEELVRQSERIRELDLRDPERVETGLREVASLADAHAQMTAALQSFSRYVPVGLVQELVRRGEVARIGGRTERLTVLFTDIQGFTSKAETMSPEELTAHMAEYFSAMLEVLDEQRATVDKFVGDAIVAFWGAPAPDPDHARNAVRAVLRCLERLRERNRDWESRGLPPLPTRFGLGTGDLVVGNVGAPDRLNYTVLGDTANTAARLEALNKRYGTEALVMQAVVDAAGPGFHFRLVDRVAVKGRVEPLAIHEPLGEAGQVPEAALERARRYEEALGLYTERRFTEAESILDEVLASAPDDGPALRLRELCRGYAAEPPPEDWDGVTRYQTK